MGDTDSTIDLEPSEVYIVNYKFDSIVYKGNCNCYYSNNANRKTNKICYLLSGKVTSLLYMADTTVYSKEEILSLKYLVANHGKFEQGREYLLSATNSRSKQYLLFTKIKSSSLNSSGEHRFYQPLHYEGLSNCYRLNIFKRIWIFLGIKDEKDYINKKNQIEDNFEKVIHKLH